VCKLEGQIVALYRGTFRSSAEKWFCPESIVPGDSSPAQDGHGMVTTFADTKAGQKQISFRVPLNLAPVFLAFKLVAPGGCCCPPPLLYPIWQIKIFVGAMLLG